MMGRMYPSIAIPHLEEMELATSRYLGALTVLNDEDLRAPSLLPGWTRGHVVAHLARNADALVNLAHWAESGKVHYMYVSQEQRDADIEEGASRSAQELREDNAAAAGRFLQALNELDVRHEDAMVARAPGAPEFPARELALRRRIEVEVHEADLGLAFTHRDWDAAFAEVLLERVMQDRAEGPAMVLRATDTGGLWKYGVQGQGPTIEGRACDLAWWVTGRGQGEGLVSDSDVLPDLGSWRTTR